MKKRSDEEAASQAQTRLQLFLDCVARLLAKRWLHEWHQQDEETRREKPRPSEGQATT